MTALKCARIMESVDDVDVLEDEYERLKAERDQLEGVLHEVEAEAVEAYHCLQSDIEHAVGSESHFFDKWWRAECKVERLQAAVDYLYGFACTCGATAEDLRERFGVEVGE